MTGTQGNATGGKSRGGLSQKVLTRKIESQEKQRLPRGLMPWLFLFGKETPLAFRACLHWKLERSREHGVVAATDRGSAKKRATASNAQREKAGFGGRRRRRSADARPVSAAKWTARCKRSLLVVRPVRHHHLGCRSVERWPSGRAGSTATSRPARLPRPGSRGTRSIAGAAAMQPLRFS